MKFSHIGIAAAAWLAGSSLASCSQSLPSGVCDGVPGVCLDLYVSYPSGTAPGYDLEVTAIYDGKSSKRLTSKPEKVSLPNHFRVVPPPGVASAEVTAIAIRASSGGELLAMAKVPSPFLAGTEHLASSVALRKYSSDIFDTKFADYIACKGPRSTRIVDLDRDSHNDIVVTCFNEQSVAVLYGTAQGQFTRIQPNLARIGMSAYFSAIMDVDRNGTLDIVTPSYETAPSITNGLSVLTSAPGRGWLLPKSVASSEMRLLDAVAADFNGDGMMELIVNTNEVAPVPPPTPPSASKLLIFPNSFLADPGNTPFKIDFQTVSGAYSLTAGFLDNDLNEDIVIAGYSSNNIAVTWGGNIQTKLGFDIYTPVPAIIQPLTPLIADVTGDKQNDIIVTQCGSPSVLIYKNLGNRQFQEFKRFDTGRGSCSAVADDFDRDGKVDLAVWNNIDFTISVLRGTGNGEFQPVQTISNLYKTSYGHLSSGDLDNDGMPDIILSGSASTDPSAVGETVRVHYNQVP